MTTFRLTRQQLDALKEYVYQRAEYSSSNDTEKDYFSDRLADAENELESLLLARDEDEDTAVRKHRVVVEITMNVRCTEKYAASVVNALLTTAGYDERQEHGVTKFEAKEFSRVLRAAMEVENAKCATVALSAAPRPRACSPAPAQSTCAASCRPSRPASMPTSARPATR